MTRTILSALIAVLLVASILPIGIADSEVRGETRVETSDGEIRVRERVEYRDDGRRVEVREEIRTRTDDIRERVRERVDEGRDRLEERRERVRQVREQLSDRREDFVDAAARLRIECRDGSGDARCNEVREQFNTHAHGLVDGTAERLLIHLDRLDAFVDEKIDIDLQAQFHARIDELRTDVQVIVDGIPEEPTRDDLREAADDLKGIWQEIREFTREVQESVVKTKVDEATRRMANLEARLESMRDTLASEGGNVTTLSELLNQFSVELNASIEAETAEDSQEHFRSAVHLLRGIMHELRDVRAEVRGDADTGRDGMDDNSSTTPEDDAGDDTGRPRVEIAGNVELSSTASNLIDDIFATLEQDATVELKVRVGRDGNETVVETETEGSLTAEQESLWADLVAEAEDLVLASGADAELEIEIEQEGLLDADAAIDVNLNDTADVEVEVTA